MSSEPNHNRQKNHKALTKKQKEAIRRKKRQRKIILLVVEILVVLILAIALFLISKLGKIERQEVPLENIEVNEGISEESKEIMKSYTTIALFGLDNRSNVYCFRSMMLNCCRRPLIMSGQDQANSKMVSALDYARGDS